MIKKLLLTAGIVFLALVLFIPGSETGYRKLRNLPILHTIIAIVFAVILIRHIITLIFTLKTVKLLKRNSVKIKKIAIILRTACIVAESETQIYVIHLYHGVNQKHRYHFEKSNILEVYKTIQTTFSTGRSNRNGIKITTRMRSGVIRTERHKRKKLFTLKHKKNKPICDIVLMNKFPEVLTDNTSDRRRNPITEGDEICDSETVIYGLNGLEKLFNNINF